MSANKIHKILFVCLGNICRSPAAQGVFQSIVDSRGRADEFLVDSAGTMRAAASRRGYDLTHRARPVSVTDFLEFDLIIAMDDSNFTDLMHLAPSVESSRKIKRMADYFTGQSMTYVPDPYYMGHEGFELVLDLLENACGNLYDSLAAGK